MRKRIITIALICVTAISCINLSGCLVDKSDSNSFISEYAAKYDFYADSVKTLKDDMDLTDEEANKIFGILIECGIDKEITYCLKKEDDNHDKYFKVHCGLNYFNIYLKDNSVEKVFDRSGYAVYPKSLLIDEYKEKYEFYEDSFKVIKKNMNLTDDETNKVFKVLVDNCVDDKITYCFNETDDNGNKYYKVWWGVISCHVYLKNNAVDKIIYSGVTIFENGKKVKPTEEPTTKNTITEPATEKSKESSVTNRNSNNNFQTYDNREQQNTTWYVLNTSTKKVHRATCSAVKKISTENYATISNLEDAYAQGYEACKKCNP